MFCKCSCHVMLLFMMSGWLNIVLIIVNVNVFIFILPNKRIKDSKTCCLKKKKNYEITITIYMVVFKFEPLLVVEARRGYILPFRCFSASCQLTKIGLNLKQIIIVNSTQYEQIGCFCTELIY